MYLFHFPSHEYFVGFQFNSRFISQNIKYNDAHVAAKKAEMYMFTTLLSRIHINRKEYPFTKHICISVQLVYERMLV